MMHTDPSDSPAARAQLFLWPGQALYIGTGRTSTAHRHLALQLGLSLGQPLRVRRSQNESFELVHGFMAYPNALHQVDAAGLPTVFLWTEIIRTSVSRGTLDPELGLVRFEQAQVAELMQALRPLLPQKLGCAEARLIFQRCLSTFLPGLGEPPAVDPRIIALLQAIREGAHAEHARPIALFARSLFLSPSRLRHLFAAQTGLTLQRYLLWQRLLRALALSIEAPSLTAAAHEAGFADLAHLTRVFRATFGLTPSEVFRNSRSVQATLCLSNYATDM